MAMGQEFTKPAETAQEVSRKVFHELHQEIIAQEDGVLKGDIDAIHDMRVAIRRLRVNLNNFAACISREDRVRLSGQLERLADALGGARDMDLMILAMKLSLKNRPAQDRPAIKSLIGRLNARRRRRLKNLIDFLHSRDYEEFKLEFSTRPVIETNENGQAA